MDTSSLTFCSSSEYSKIESLNSSTGGSDGVSLFGIFNLISLFMQLSLLNLFVTVFIGDLVLTDVRLSFGDDILKFDDNTERLALELLIVLLTDDDRTGMHGDCWAVSRVFILMEALRSSFLSGDLPLEATQSLDNDCGVKRVFVDGSGVAVLACDFIGEVFLDKNGFVI